MRKLARQLQNSEDQKFSLPSVDDDRPMDINDWLAVLVCSMSIMGLFSDSKGHRKWLWYSCSLALVLAIFWVYHLLRLPKFRWDVIWLPLGPVCGAGVCVYVDHVLSESSEEVRKLRSYMYAFKAG
ncbi:hypothetical protein V6N13_144795 [Hibiscus sabdariffa]